MTQIGEAGNDGNMIRTNIEPLVDTGSSDLLSDTLDVPLQSVVLNLENKEKMQGKKMEKNRLAHRWYLIHATMPIVFISEIVLSHLSSMVESYSSSLLLMHGQIVSRENSTGLEHINILLDLSSTRD